MNALVKLSPSEEFAAYLFYLFECFILGQIIAFVIAPMIAQ